MVGTCLCGEMLVGSGCLSMGRCWWTVSTCLWGDVGEQWALDYGGMLVSSGRLSMGNIGEQ